VDPDIAGKRVGENNTQQFSWHWPGDDESIHLMLTSVVHTTISSIVIAAIGGLPDPCRKIRALWGGQEEPTGDGGPHACNDTLILDISPAARCVMAGIKFINPTIFWLLYHGQQAKGTSGAQTLMRGGRSYDPLDVILPPPAQYIIDDIGEESDDDANTHCPNSMSFPTTKSNFQKF